jgi:ABC-type sulfate transport system permease component
MNPPRLLYKLRIAYSPKGLLLSFINIGFPSTIKTFRDLFSQGMADRVEIAAFRTFYKTNKIQFQIIMAGGG